MIHSRAFHMSDELASLEPKIAIAVIGDGCAGLSLAAQAASLPEHEIHLFSPQIDTPDFDHVWGYWQMDWLQDVIGLADKTWHRWSIQTADTEIEMEASKHPYQVVTRKKWLGYCRLKAKQNGVSFNTDMSLIDNFSYEHVFDSRPPRTSSNMMLQHFIGWEVQAKPGSFDDSKAILMDFRCDQSHGMHFIYCLPFSDSQALVESTVFSPNIEQDGFYEAAISTWLSDCAGVGQFKVLRREKGAIPLGLMRRHDQNYQGIGGNCGAIRPSSGYAFSFIQKQIRKAIRSFEESKKLIFVSPHKKIDLWMDKIFLSVLRHQPQYAPRIFSALAKSLTGDEFAKFLSGEASLKMRIKVIFAMPVWPFITALIRPERCV